MNYKYFPQTEEDIRKMLDKIGVETLDDLFAEIPESIRFKGDFHLPSAKSELEVRRYFDELCTKNQSLTVFAGAGVYDHYTPSIVPNIVERSEFLTSYTPYQAEISQGTLHYIFEYQSMMSTLTGLPVSNASMYDGSTATAEAMLMAFSSAKKADTVLLSSTLDPKIKRVVETYARFHGVKLDYINESNGVTDKNDMAEKLAKGGVAGVVVQQPNYYGNIEDFTGYADLCHDAKALFVINSVASDLALLKTPGEWGADVAVGDGQSLGIPMSYGGPSVGYMCCTEKLMRKMPGRIVGMTKDSRDQRAFVLTLQAREQHIRRQKATSNICYNQSLMALFVTIYLSVMGKEGLKDVAKRSYDGAHYLYDELLKTGKFKSAFNQPFFNEFCVKYQGDVAELQRRLLEHGILAGVRVSDDTLMLAVTEKRTKAEIDKLVTLMKEEES